MPGPISIRVATQNIKDFNPSLPYGVVRDLVGRVVRTVGNDGLIGFQEIGTDHHKRALADELAHRGWSFTFGGDAERTMDAPVAWNPAIWRFKRHGREILHGKIEGLPSPARYATWVVLTHKATGQDVALVSCHPVSGAWSATAKPKQGERRSKWLNAQRVLKDLVARRTADGTPVLLVGDFNRRQGHPLGWVVPDGYAGLDVDAGTKSAPMAIDHIYAIGETEATWRLGPLHTEKTPSDHALRWCGATLRTKATGKPATPTTTEEVPMGPLDKITWDDGGKTVDRLTAAALREVERRLGYSLTVVQGSYNAGGVAASAGTHDGGGAVDLLAWDWENKVRALRAVGFAAWYRPTIPGHWNAHIHAILIGNPALSQGAKNQVAAYYAKRDGLKSNAHDPFWRPKTIPVYTWADATAPRPEPLLAKFKKAKKTADRVRIATQIAKTAESPATRKAAAAWLEAQKDLHTARTNLIESEAAA